MYTFLGGASIVLGGNVALGTLVVHLDDGIGIRDPSLEFGSALALLFESDENGEFYMVVGWSFTAVVCGQNCGFLLFFVGGDTLAAAGRLGLLTRGVW